MSDAAAKPSSAETATLRVPGGEHEMQIVPAVEGASGIDLGKLLASTGYITLDPGFVNTGAASSAICYIDGDAGILRYRGYPIEQLAEKSSFMEVSYLLIYGELPTAEHFMMYHKALLMGDQDVASQLLEEQNALPSKAKALGRKVKNFDEELWKAEADRVVKEGNLAKFSQNPKLKEILLGTGDLTLVEAR